MPTIEGLELVTFSMKYAVAETDSAGLHHNLEKHLADWDKLHSPSLVLVDSQGSSNRMTAITKNTSLPE